MKIHFFMKNVKTKEIFIFPCQNRSWEVLVAIFGIYAKNAAQRWGREPLKRSVGFFPGDLFLWLWPRHIYLALAFSYYYYFIGRLFFLLPCIGRQGVLPVSKS